MRIALVHYTCLPVIAGVELVMAEHARLFAEAGHEVTIVCHQSERVPSVSGEDWRARPPLLHTVPEHFNSEGEQAPGLIFSPPRILAIPEMDPCSLEAVRAQHEGPRAVGEAMRTKLRAVLAEQDVVLLHNVVTMHFHLPLTQVLWGLAHELVAVRFVCWVHDLAACNPDYELPPLDTPPWSLLKEAHPCFTYVAVSELRRRQLLELTGLPASACRVVPNGVEPAALLDFSPRTIRAEARHRWLERDVILLQPARLLRRKNIEMTLRVTAAIKAAGRSCACLITAPPDMPNPAASAYESELRELRAQLKLEQDAFFLNEAGPIDAGEMRGLFSLADALFFPSRQEGFGLPVLEAAIHRVPIFCPDIDPLNTLLARGVTTFPLTLPPAQIAALLWQTLEADAAHCARKQTLRTYSWDAIYRNFLAPLLANHDTCQRL